MFVKKKHIPSSGECFDCQQLPLKRGIFWGGGGGGREWVRVVGGKLSVDWRVAEAGFSEWRQHYSISCSHTCVHRLADMWSGDDGLD